MSKNIPAKLKQIVPDASKAKKYTTLIFFVLAIAVTALFYYDVVFQGKTMLGPGYTAGVMGDDGPYGYTRNTDDPEYLSFPMFLKDLGSNAWAGEPQVVKATQLFRQFTLPLWNDNLQLGKPLAANFLSNPFFPLKIILYAIPSAVGWDMYLLLRFIIGIFFLYLFLREIGVKEFPAFIGGVAFAFSGYFVLFQNIQNMDSELTAPILFWAVAYTMNIAKRSTIKPWQYIAVIVGLLAVFLSNIPEPLFLVLAGGATYWLYRLIASFFHDGKEVFQRSLIVSLKVFVPAVLIVLPLFLMNYEFVLNAMTLHAKEFKVGLQWYTDIRYAIAGAIPFFPNQSFFIPDAPTIPNNLNYIGLVGFFLAMTGALVALIKRRSFLFLLILFIITFLKIYGLTFVHDVIGNLPGFDRILYLKYGHVFISFTLACLVGIGLDALIERTVRFWLYVIGATTAFVLIFTGMHYIPGGPLSLSNSVLLVITFFLLFTLGSVIFIPQLEKHHRVLLGALFGSLLIIELMIYVPHKGRPDRYESFVVPPFVEFLQKTKKPYRIFAFDRLLYPGISSAFDLDDIRDLDGLYVKEYFTYIKTFISPGVYDRFTGHQESTSEVDPVNYVGNPLFDLMNVKYVLAKNYPLELLPVNMMIQAMLQEVEQTPGLREIVMKIKNNHKRALLLHAPGEICTTVAVSEQEKLLHLSAGMDEVGWEYPGSDGVDFSIQTPEGETLFSTTVDPTNNPTDRHWFEYDVDLSQFIGTTPTLCFTSDVRTNSLADIFGIADLRLTSAEQEMNREDQTQYKMVYNKEIYIFENTDVLARGFLVGDVNSVETEAAVIEVLQNKTFDPRAQAVVLADDSLDVLPDFDGETCAGVGITEYTLKNANKFSFQVDSPGSCFLVWSDTFYPGWVVDVDGKNHDIYQTNLMFRGIALGPGMHTVKFSYRPMTFYAGLFATALGVVAVILFSFRFKQEKQFDPGAPKRTTTIGKKKKSRFVLRRKK